MRNSIIHSLFLLMLLITSAISIALLTGRENKQVIRFDGYALKFEDIDKYIIAQEDPDDPKRGPDLGDIRVAWTPKSLRPGATPMPERGAVDKPTCRWYYLGCDTWQEGVEVASNGFGIISPLITLGTWAIWWRKKKNE